MYASYQPPNFPFSKILPFVIPFVEPLCKICNQNSQLNKETPKSTVILQAVLFSKICVNLHLATNCPNQTVICCKFTFTTIIHQNSQFIMQFHSFFQFQYVCNIILILILFGKKGINCIGICLNCSEFMSQYQPPNFPFSKMILFVDQYRFYFEVNSVILR